ncbi:hypothetical protein BT96DRAFT_978389 [Gymnopus androsaceus JB14]|uniref:Uncharacterized protein n=1 Tax=Gymnopus androsaceus JB14 TaxID=1447944 RepID=A0A6A4H927_9AGAR|nr:hypothetical protein BT96DRAFT_978389 [Gymnopus androsaceus JB14]
MSRTSSGGFQTSDGTLYVSKPFKSKSSKKLRAVITFAPRQSTFDINNESSGAKVKTANMLNDESGPIIRYTTTSSIYHLRWLSALVKITKNAYARWFQLGHKTAFGEEYDPSRYCELVEQDVLTLSNIDPRCFEIVTIDGWYRSNRSDKLNDLNDCWDHWHDEFTITGSVVEIVEMETRRRGGWESQGRVKKPYGNT